MSGAFRAVRVGLTVACTVIAGCKTIKIEESDAFDRRRTINVDALRARGYAVADHRVGVAAGVSLHARHIVAPNARATILLFGGNGFLMVTAYDLLEALLALDVSVVMFDYRGYGQSDGEPSVAALKADALKIHAWVRGPLGVPQERLVLHGHSLGSLVATWVATKERSAGLILESPLTDVEDMTDRMTPWLADVFISFDIAAVLKAEKNRTRLPTVDVPVLLMVGEDDNVTPKAMAEDLYAVAPEGSRLVVIEGRGHNDLPPTKPYRAAYDAFLKTVVR